MYITENNPADNYPDLKQSWTLFGVFLLLKIFFSLLVGVLQKQIPGFSASHAMEWAKLGMYIFPFIITFWFAKLTSLSPKFDYGLVLKKFPGWFILVLLIITPAMAIVVNQVVSFIPMPEEVEKMFAEMVSITLPSFLSAVIAAPILEELLCRGIILRGLLKNLPPYHAILWSALIFSIMHLNIWQGVTALIVGFISGWIFWKTKSIIPSILLHFFNNAFAFILLYTANDPSETIDDTMGGSYITILIVSLVIFGGGLFFIYKKLNSISE